MAEWAARSLMRSGRLQEGRRLLDAVLDSSERSHDTLVAVSSVLREVGSVSAARQLAEEAHAAAEDAAQ